MIFAALLFTLAVLAFVYMCGVKEDPPRRYSLYVSLAALICSVLVYLSQVR